jgi:hypothetical protein
MNYTVRIGRSVLESAHSDLNRPHAFALERVGFLWGRTALLGAAATAVLINDFTAVNDEDYIDGTEMVACINATAIRTALARVLETRESCFHFHLHAHSGIPQLSRTDARELDPLLRTFVSAAPNAVHGALIASLDAANAWVSSRGSLGGCPVESVSVIGFPTTVWRLR